MTVNGVKWPIKYDYGLFINGKWIPSENGQKEDIINPATEEVIGRATVGTVHDLDHAIHAARNAFDRGTWPRMSPKERSSKMQAFREALIKRKEEIINLMIGESGITYGVAYSTYLLSIDYLKYFAEAAARDPVTSIPVDVNLGADGRKILGAGALVREPKGVVGAITPFNNPFFINVGKIGPALATGNTIILKPSPYTPLEAFILAEAAIEAELPDGVLNIITGGNDVGQCLTTDQRIDMISFTGSDMVGAAVMEQSASTLKRVHLELGGKSPLIVRHDADLNKVIPRAVGTLTALCGQGCSLLTRHIVHNSIKDKFIERLKGGLEKVVIGDPANQKVMMGPLIREKQRERVESYIQEGLKEGGTLVTGGRRPDGLGKGFFYQPTLFTDVDNSWKISQDEIFGPVGVVMGFDNDEEAIKIANESRYGLAAHIYSEDTGHAFEMAKHIRAGQVSLNGGYGVMTVHAPFGGFKRSGIGREFGEEGLNEFTELKAILFHGA